MRQRPRSGGAGRSAIEIDASFVVRQRVYEQVVRVSIDADDAPAFHTLAAGTQGWPGPAPGHHTLGGHPRIIPRLDLSTRGFLSGHLECTVLVIVLNEKPLSTVNQHCECNQAIIAPAHPLI